MREQVMPVYNIIFMDDIDKLLDNSDIFITSEISFSKFDLNPCVKDNENFFNSKVIDMNLGDVSDVDVSLHYMSENFDEEALFTVYLLLQLVNDSGRKIREVFYKESARWELEEYHPAMFVGNIEDTEDSILGGSDLKTLSDIAENFFFYIKPKLSNNKYLCVVNALNNFHAALDTTTLNTSFILISVALESLFSFSESEITHKISESLSRFHFPSDKDKRIDLYNKMKNIYKIRSTLVHGKILKPREENYEVYKWGRDILRKSLMKILIDKKNIDIYENEEGARKYFSDLVLS